MTMIEYLILYVSKGRLNLILYPISPMYLKMLRKRVSQFLSFKFEKETFVLSSRKKTVKHDFLALEFRNIHDPISCWH